MASSRYYEDKEAEIQPGKISPELRAALNLADNDIPIWIYRMRAIGYPPGWLRKAIVDTEDIFATDPIPEEEANKSGKRKGGPEQNETKYDHSKLIEYPGFNMPLPPNTHDYHYYYNMPPMLPHQQLDYAKQIMSKPAPVPSFKRPRTSSGSTNNQSTSSANKGEDDEESSDEEEESPASPDPEPSDEAANESTSSDQEKKPDVNSISDKDLNKSSTSTVNNRSSLSLNSSLTDGIKLVSKGSPMPRPVERLPLEKFSQGVVGELLYFENIPSSTGKFDSLRGLLDTMRRSKSEADTSFASSTKSAKED